MSNKYPELVYLINKFNVAVLLVTESWLIKPGFHYEISGLIDVRSDGRYGYSGVALFFKNKNLSLSSIYVPFYGFQIIVVRVKEYTILSLYHRDHLNYGSWHNFTMELKKYPQEKV